MHKQQEHPHAHQKRSPAQGVAIDLFRLPLGNDHHQPQNDKQWSEPAQLLTNGGYHLLTPVKMALRQAIRDKETPSHLQQQQQFSGTQNPLSGPLIDTHFTSAIHN